MTVTGYKRSLVVLSIAVVLLLACVWHLVWRYSLQRADARAAWSTVVDYERSQRVLGAMTVNDTVAYLDAITRANLSASDRHLSMIMQRERTRVVRDVIQELRKKTGEDLGEDPQAWIKRYHRTLGATLSPNPQSSAGTSAATH